MENVTALTPTPESAPTQIVTYSPLGMLTQAVERGLPPETLEKLMAMADKWEAKQAKSEFFKALSRFQGKVPEITKSKKVGYESKTSNSKVDYSFAPLGKIAKVIQPFLEECGLSYRWEFEDLPDREIKGTCIVSHIGGHSEHTTMKAKEDNSGSKNAIQSVGSARSYIQRYTLIGALGLTTADADNDGKGVDHNPPPNTNGIPAPPDANKVKEIKTCQTLDQLNEAWGKLSDKEKATYKKTFGSVRSLIEDAQKKEK